MSDIIEGAEDQPDESVEMVDEVVEASGDEVGLTSDEVEQAESEQADDAVEDGDEKKSLLESMTVYDAMLLVSLICVGLATLLLFFELRTFGNFPSSFPWRTSGF